MNKSIYETQVRQILKDAGYKFEEEFRFDIKRKFRFDFAFPKQKIAIEIDGATWTRGRHSFGTGYKNDCVKFNLAVIQGWRILKYVPETMSNILDDLEKIIK